MEEVRLPDVYVNYNRILDQEGNELDINNLDLNTGKLVDETILIQDIPFSPEVPSEEHFEVERFYFVYISSISIEDMYTDPHVKIINEKEGNFGYVDQGEGKDWRGLIDTKLVIDKEGHGEIPAERVYEEIRRYVPFTPEEQKEFDDKMIEETNKQIFLNTGFERLMNVEDNVDDVMLVLAEMIGA